MGAVLHPSAGGLAPIRIEPSRLSGTDHVLAVASAQVKSALLLAGLLADGTTSVQEPAQSRDHTERMLAYLGVFIDRSTERLIVGKTRLSADCSIGIPGDMSAAAFPLVASAILPGSRLTITGVGLNPTRCGIIDVLRAYGAEVAVTDEHESYGEPRGTLTVAAADRRPLEVGGPLAVRAIDELPLVAVLGAFAEGTTVVTDAGELRVKESDRIAAVTDELRSMGADIKATPDGFVVKGRGGDGIGGGTVHGHGDHRIAMALAVAALAAPGGPTSIEGWETADVSYPGFAQAMASVAVR
jgi:3-phosphoshikimate 1-carboxyvinyltransferase